MEKGRTILYELYGNLYVNLTNRCPCACTFCLRQTRETVADSGDTLWLEKEPSVEEVKKEFSRYDMDKYQEIVFCGYGEPTERLDAILPLADFIKKEYGKPIRINTNGLANLIWNRDVTPELKNRIDTVSISLNHPDPKRYQEIVRSKFGDGSFQAMLDFAKYAAKYVPKVVMTTVETVLTKEEEQRCQEICNSIGVKYRIRAWQG